MVKRITYLERRGDLSEVQFRRHWATTHAEIAKGLPRVLSYRQNHVTATESSGEVAEPFRIDGIVELWFADEAAAGAGFGSEIADRLIEDEKRFLSGLTGSAVQAGEPTPAWSEKLWLLAMAGEGIGGAEAEAWAEEVAARLTADGFALNLLDESAPVLQREALRREPELPRFAIAFGFATAGKATTRLRSLVYAADEAEVSGVKLFRRPQALLTEELRII